MVTFIYRQAIYSEKIMRFLKIFFADSKPFVDLEQIH